MSEQPPHIPTNETDDKSSKALQSEPPKYSPLKSAIKEQTEPDYSQLQQQYYQSASSRLILDEQNDVQSTTTTGDWIIFVILLLIPIVNLIAMIIFACDNSKPSRANFAKALLIIMGICIILGFLYSHIISNTFH